MERLLNEQHACPCHRKRPFITLTNMVFCISLRRKMTAGLVGFSYTLEGVEAVRLRHPLVAMV